MWEDLSYNDKISLTNKVATACSMHDIKYLKELLPTPHDLGEYRDMQKGGGILHTLMYAYDTKETSSSVEFLKEIMKVYDIENNPQLKEALFMKRNAGGKLAADFTYIEEYLRPDLKKCFLDWRGHDVSQMTDVEDKRTQGEKNKVELYLFIKEKVKAMKTATTKEDAHAIISPYQDRSEASVDQFDKGTPVSDAMYLPDGKGNLGAYMIGSAHEEYPELRLRNFRNKENKEDYCVLRGLRPDSKETLLSQAIDRIDFPEDYAEHFHTLEVFEDDYKRLKEDEGKAATYRYFTQNRGAVIFESGQDEIDGNGKGSYGGYFTSYLTEENGKNIGYPVVVIPSLPPDHYSAQHKYKGKYKDIWGNNNERPLYHELFHVADLSGSFHFSEMPIFQYAMMLTETDKNNRIVDPFQIVARYPASEYHKEMAAQIMGIADDSVLEKSPILQKIHKLGEYFAIAKLNNNTGALSYLSTVTDSLLGKIDFRMTNDYFMAAKKGGKPFDGLNEEKRTDLEKKFIIVLDKAVKKMEGMFGEKTQGMDIVHNLSR